MPGCTVETHGTLAGKDAWHVKKGHRSRQVLKTITCHEQWGEVERKMVGIDRVRHAISEKQKEAA